MEAYILKMEPALKTKVWGGRRLETLGRSLPDSEFYGESWEVSGLEDGPSKIANGPLKSKTLIEASEILGKSLLGEHPVFPLLVKFLDAREDLSVQVHPGARHIDEIRSKFGESADSKDEAWLILDADDEGSILWGVKERIDSETMGAALREGTLVSYLRRIRVKKGDVFRVPPGTIHAICAGVLLLEIQEPSDTTYRLYDYERPGLDGEPRELHIEQALHVARRFPEDPTEVRCLDGEPLTDTRSVLLVDAPTYRIERFQLVDHSEALTLNAPGPYVLTVLDGHIWLNDVELRDWDSAVIPAQFSNVHVQGSGTFVLSAARS